MNDPIEDINWSLIQHSHGSAYRFPEWFQLLQSNDAAVREAAREKLFEYSNHQQSIYEVTSYLVRVFLVLIASPETPERDRLLHHLGDLAHGCRPGVDINEYGGNERLTHQEILKGRDIFRELTRADDPALVAAAAYVLESVKEDRK